MKKTNRSTMLTLFRKRSSPDKIQKYHSESSKNVKFKPSTQISQTPYLYKNSSALRTRKMAAALSQIMTWDINSMLTLYTKKLITNTEDLVEILGCIIDDYDGLVIKKPIVLSIYLMLGVHIEFKEDQNYGNYTYQVSLNKRISFKVMSPPFEDSKSVMNWTKTKGVGLEWYRIEFKLEMNPTKRNGHPFVYLYNIPVKTRQNPEFIELCQEFGIQYILDDEELSICL